MDSSRNDRRARLAGAGWAAFLGLVLLVLPFSLDVRIMEPDAPATSTRIPLVDPLLLAGLAVAIVAGGLRADVWRRIGSPMTFVGVSLLATLPRLGAGGSATECLQRIDYFLVAYALGAAAPFGSLRKALGAVLTGVTALFVGISLLQVLALGEPPFRVTSLFENRHLYSGWMGIALAMLAARWPFPRLRSSAGAAVLIGISLLTSTTLLPLVGLAVGTAVACCTRKGWRGLGHAGLATAIMAGIFFLAAPRAQVRSSLDEWSLHDADSLEAVDRQGAQIDALQTRLPLGTFKRGNRTYTIALPNWHPPAQIAPNPRREGRFEPGYVRQRFLEWQAALYAAASSPVLGSGLGSYQTQTASNYLTFKKLRTLEPDTQSAYAVELVCTGLIGVLVLVRLLVGSLGSALRAVRRKEPEADSSHVRSLLAGLVTASLVGFAIPLFTCSLAVLVVLMAAAVGQLETAEYAPPSPD